MSRATRVEGREPVVAHANWNERMQFYATAIQI